MFTKANSILWGIFFSCAVAHSKSAKFTMEKVRVEVGGKTVFVEVADTPAKRERGLMERTKLNADTGMLFVFDAPGNLQFWMKKTLIPLSIAYFDSQKRFLNSHEMVSEPKVADYRLRLYASLGPAQYALEMPRGWFQKNPLRRGESTFTILSP